ncbi:gliding motility-associated ABC transporter permease subunit GldF [Emticicia sp. 21SJ11W-3]|uniref:gliding motility-associated ABC transporter permease subunit GldF n=1 Tax=Emticicia sp. 21SJ11W-3 TaxID=2916755 RepID=UPI00209C8D14|nr:gliding motility-associated ABC transporter permease subunit GldF [Emticicia sp. 21SJ11W-3]UTA70096.1 gliding motility-associated ABC transporter permease subunit GldF [Emticicia sp. 21SJ11W-3]
MLNIFRKELSSFLNSLVAYIVIGVFLVLAGLFTWVFEGNVLDYGFADMTSFFQLAPYIFIFLIPAITMRLFSEEFKSGTIELLFTKPLTDWQIIIGKFLASFVLIVIALLPTLLYYYSLSVLGNPKANIDTSSVIGSYIGLFYLGAVFASIGLFTSSLTDNQVVAFILGSVGCFILYDGVHQLAQLFNGVTQYSIDYLGLSFHYESISRGLVDSRTLVYFTSIIVLMLYFTKIQVSGKKS